MPLHNWSRVRAGTYHNFHYRWIASIMDQLNSGILPPGCFAMAEQVIGGPAPDVVTLKFDDGYPLSSTAGALALAEPPAKPVTSIMMLADIDRYAQKANRIVVRHEAGEVLAVIEIVSPGNKNSSHAIRSLVDKLVALLYQGINLLVIDPLLPTPRDPEGIHALIWNEITGEPFVLPDGRPLTMAAYQAEPIKTAWVEPIAPGAPLPVMPLFLRGEYFVNLPLEASYEATWRVLPIELQRMIDHPTVE